MDVAAYLKELLNRQQQVFVPGLGSFFIRKKAGFEQHDQFYPPESQVDFVAAANGDDAFAEYISAQKNISVQAASYFIEKFADQLKKNADAQNVPVKEALFAAENKTVTSFNQENFGLTPVKLSLLKKQQLIEAIPEANDQEVLPQKDYVENFYREFSSSLPQEPDETKKSSRFWIAIVLLLAVCCAGIYALYLYNPNLFKSFLPANQADTTVVVLAAADTAKQAPVTNQSAKIDTTTVQLKADTLQKTTVPPPQQTEKDTVKTVDADMVAKSPYEIIGASFKTLKGAKTFLAQLQSRGMRNAKILNNTAGKQVLITFGSYQDKASAQAALEKIRTKDAQSEAYIQHYLNK